MTPRALALVLLLAMVGASPAAAGNGGGEPNLDRWVERLAERDAYTRRWAAGWIAQLGPDAAPAASALVRTLGEGLAEDAVEDALLAIGAPAIPPLSGGLNDPDPERRAACARALGRFGPMAAAALGVLQRRGRDPAEPFRAEMLAAIARIDPTDPWIAAELTTLAKAGSWPAALGLAVLPVGGTARLIEVLAAPGSGLRKKVGKELRWAADLLPPHREALRRLLASPYSGISEWAAVLLAPIDPGADGLPSGLAGALGRRWGLKEAALRAMVALGPRAGVPLDVAVAALVDRPSVLALDAVLALEPPAAVARELLLDLLRKETRRASPVRERAARLLADRGAESRAAVPILAAALSEEWVQEVHICATLRLNDRVGHPFAAEALGRFGPLALEAVPALEAAFEGGGFFYDLDVPVLRALGEIGPPAAAALERLHAAARESLQLELLVARVRAETGVPERVGDVVRAIRAGREFPLIMCRPFVGLPRVWPDDPLLPAFEAGLAAPAPGMRVACARLVREITGTHGRAGSVLVDLLADVDDEARLAAALELARGRTELAHALEVLRGFLQGYVEGRVFHVPVILEGLADLGELAATAQPEVAATVDGPWEVYRLPALRCLARLGSGAQEIRNRLTPSLRHEDPEVRAAARAALRSLTRGR